MLSPRPQNLYQFIALGVCKEVKKKCKMILSTIIEAWELFQYFEYT